MLVCTIQATVDPSSSWVRQVTYVTIFAFSRSVARAPLYNDYFDLPEFLGSYIGVACIMISCRVSEGGERGK